MSGAFGYFVLQTLNNSNHVLRMYNLMLLGYYAIIMQTN